MVKRDEVRAAGCVPNHERAAGCVYECKILVCNPFVFATSCHEVGVHVARAEEGEDVNLFVGGSKLATYLPAPFAERLRKCGAENGLNEQCEDRVHGVLRLSRRFARVDGEEVVDVARAGMKLD